MSGIKLTWDIGAFNPEKHFIYRSASPISPSNLPTPIAEVGQGINQYNDLSVTDGETYHYFVAAEKMGLLCPADSSVRVQAIKLGPGPQTLIGGDMTAGFFGETTTDELITGDALAAEIGLTVGVSQFNTEPWLKFALDGNILYVAKKPYRHSLNWDDIYQAGAVYGTSDNGLYATGTSVIQNKSITLGGLDFSVTLIEGVNGDPTPENSGWDTSITHGSEWNRLFYPIHSGIHTDNRNTTNPSISYNQWASYSDTDLQLGYQTTGGRFWCQETISTNTAMRIHRGYVGISYVGTDPYDYHANTSTYQYRGWRPVLRLQL